MQYSRGLSSPAAWRAALESRPSDVSAKLGLAQALIARAMEAEADAGMEVEEDLESDDEMSYLCECAEALSSIQDLDSLSNGDALIFASTTARCATRLQELGRPRLALTILTPAIALLDSRACLAGSAPTLEAKPDAMADTLDESPLPDVQVVDGYAPRSGFTPVNEEDTPPGALFDRTWPLPAVSWHYMRATLSGAAGAAWIAIHDLERAIDELSHAALIALAGAPMDYARTADVSMLIGQQLKDALAAKQ